MVRRRGTVVTLGLLASALMASWLPGLRVDNSMESFLHAEDPALLRYNAFRDRFDSDSRLLILVRPPEIFTLEFLSRLRELHRALESEVPYVEEITSLINARNTRGEGDELIVEDLLAVWPTDAVALRALRERVLSNPLYRNVLISENARITSVTLKPFTYSTSSGEADELAGFADPDVFGDIEGGPAYLTEAEEYVLVEAVTRVTSRLAGPEFELFLLGGPVMNYRMSQALSRDVAIFMSLSLALNALLLYLLFRRLTAVVLPLGVVGAALVGSVGIMARLDIPLSITL